MNLPCPRLADRLLALVRDYPDFPIRGEQPVGLVLRDYTDEVEHTFQLPVSGVLALEVEVQKVKEDRHGGVRFRAAWNTQRRLVILWAEW